MENYHFTEEIIFNVKKWVEYINNGHFGNPKDIVDAYNTVFAGIKKPQPQTRCGSCLRRCVRMMNDALLQYEQQQLQVLEVIDEVLSEEDEPKMEEKPKRKVKKTN